MRGLRTKTENFLLSTIARTTDVICVTETWLNDNINSSELFDNKYNVFRKDRDRLLSGKLDGGGVLIAVASQYEAMEKSAWSCNGVCEDLWVSIKLSKTKSLHMCCVYVPPHASVENLRAHLLKVTEIVQNYKDDYFLVVGDYNIAGIVWNHDNVNNSYTALNTANGFGESLVDSFNFLSFYQYNGIHNMGGSLLDLVFSSKNDVTVVASDLPFVPEDIYHKCLEIYFSVDVHNSNLSFKNPFYKLNFFKANYELINSEIEKVNWDNEFFKLNVEQSTIVFYNIINGIISKFISKKNINYKFPVWYSAQTKALLKEKSKLHKRWKKYKNILDYQEFSSVRKQVKLSIKIDFKKYVNRIESDVVSNVKNFWSFVSNRRRCKTVPKFIQSQDKVYSADVDIANAFAQYFGSVFEPSTISSSVRPVASVNALVINVITDAEVKKQLNELNINKGAGPDGLPPIFLKSCVDSIYYPLLIIFNKSLSEGIFPSVWKRAQVVPILKGGNKNTVSNYRPISMLSVPGKVFEAIVTNELFFKTKHLISEHQHGFFRGRSVATNLISFVQSTIDSMSNRKQVDAVYTDFSKAFDKIHHNTLLVKLENIGVHGSLLRWVTSYVQNRSQCVKINNVTSSYINITSGVPQGSHLGPLLFSLFMYDIGQCFVYSNYCLYADDLKVYKTICDINDCTNFQSDLCRFQNYCKLNKLYLNIDKCHYITFSRLTINYLFPYHINNTLLTKVKSVKDLGVMLDSKLVFDTHIENIIRKAYRNLGFIARNTKSFTKPASVVALYNSLVRSHLEFVSIVWNPNYVKYIERIEKVQIKFINMLNYRFCRHLHYRPYEISLKHYRILKLSSRRLISYVLFLYRLLNSNIDCDYILSELNFNIKLRTTRSTNLFYLNVNSNNYSCNSPITLIQRNYNEYFNHIDLFDKSLNQIKRCAIDVFC